MNRGIMAKSSLTQTTVLREQGHYGQKQFNTNYGT